MKKDRINPVNFFDNLRRSVERLLSKPVKNFYSTDQIEFGFLKSSKDLLKIPVPTKNVKEFLDVMVSLMPNGNVYIFGGVLRDLFFLGKKKFSSDIDLVVEGDWGTCDAYFKYLGARKNKFGGYRLIVDGWELDIWRAKDTWAIRHGYVEYIGIRSLTKTTVLNWDAILMNWRSRSFICSDQYIEDLHNKRLDLVLEKNPNPIGMATRVFRHLCRNDAKYITLNAAEYLSKCTRIYSFDDLRDKEISSYGNFFIEPKIYAFFEESEIINDLLNSKNKGVDFDKGKCRDIQISSIVPAQYELNI